VVLLPSKLQAPWMASTNFIRNTLRRELDHRYGRGGPVSVIDTPTYQSEYQAAVGASTAAKAGYVTAHRYAAQSRVERREPETPRETPRKMGGSRRRRRRGANKSGGGAGGGGGGGFGGGSTKAAGGRLPDMAPDWDTEYKAACGATPREHKARYALRSQQLSPTQKVQPREWDRTLAPRGRKDDVVDDCVWQSEYMAGSGQVPEHKPKYMSADMRHFQVHAAPGAVVTAKPSMPMTARTAALRRGARPQTTQLTRERAAASAKRSGAKKSRAGLFDVGRGVGLPDFTSEYAASLGAGLADKPIYISADDDDRRCHGPKPDIALFTNRQPPVLGESILQGATGMVM